jgi:D-glycero-alpha-D-manno-heptose 1-phosphate guanylyltransferase
MKNFNRYGFAKVNENSQVVAFEEKKYQETGHIDGGIYAIKRTIFDGYKTQN